MEQNKDILYEAVARLRRDAHSQEPPKAVIDETLRQLAAGLYTLASRTEELSRRQLVQPLVNVRPEDRDAYDETIDITQ